jgi:hypothetical protein
MAHYSRNPDSQRVSEEAPALWDPLGVWPAARPWLWAAVGLLAASAMGPVYLGELSRRDDSMTDFFQEWASARNYLEGLPLYTEHAVTVPRYLGREGSPRRDLFVGVNAHPPTSILIALPFGAMPYRQAVFLWRLCSAAMLFGSLTLVWRGLRIPSVWWSPFPATTLILSCVPLLMHLYFAQFSLLILLLLTGAWAADRANRSILAGALLGASVTIKLFPAAVFLFFVATRRWKTVIAALLSTALMTLLTTVVFGREVYWYYVGYVIPRVARYRGLCFNLSLPGYWTKLFDPPGEYPGIEPLVTSPLLARTATIVTCALVVISIWLALRRARSRAALDLGFGLTMTGMLLLSPIVWDHYLVLLLIPLATVWTQLPRSRLARFLLVMIVVALWCWNYTVFELTIPGGIVGGVAGPAHTLTIGSYQCYALLALFGLQLAALRRLERASAGDRSMAGARLQSRWESERVVG